MVGAGEMGSGIVRKMAAEGFDVLLVDRDDDRVSGGLRHIRDSLHEAVRRESLGPAEAETILGRIEGRPDWDCLADADLVVEAVFEDLAATTQVFERLDQVCRPEAILATSTSSLSIDSLAATTSLPDRVLGLHYFFPPTENRLVEVVPGERTARSVSDRAWALQIQLGKIPIASADRPGFVVYRYLVPWLNEAVRLLEEGLADIPTIERAARDSFGVATGPFERMNLTALPTVLDAATALGEAIGPFYAPAERLRAQAESGRDWDLAGEADPSRGPAVAERLMAVTFCVASALVAEGVGTVEDTDIGARVGLRWPHGPFEMINRYGVERATELAESLAKRWNLTVPRMLEKHARSCKPFVFRLVRSEVRGAIATLTINRPDALNALNPNVLAQLHDAFRQVAEDDEVRGIVIAGSGRVFSAGSDVRFFVRKIDEGSPEAIVEFAKAGHALMRDIDACPKPVVARLHGPALGGGLELALACDAIVAADTASFAFPETGIGIYPGLGGTQRTPRRIGVGLARWMVFTGETVVAAEALSAGLVDQVVEFDQLDQAVREIVETGSPPARPGGPLPERLRRLEAFFESHSADDLLEGGADPGEDEALARAVSRVRSHSPVALRLADRLIVEGSRRSLEEGLRMEIEHRAEVFATREAYRGLSTLGRGNPAAEGR